ncbi:unnamed protein product [Didymodactylos carnosus]|uniref:Uncharacterized protein n=1 Tax=Didymodactylos carnosus TaxID=1234261 RepID=A0A8S2CVD1_9BILA|nr:unnamed protein product [Didymodactylos carnosus]CAF3552852.1 unnamed protein product [Didymodactylos carnosus]
MVLTRLQIKNAQLDPSGTSATDNDVENSQDDNLKMYDESELAQNVQNNLVNYQQQQSNNEPHIEHQQDREIPLELMCNLIIPFIERP